MDTTTILLILIGLCVVVGIVGSILPGIPGPPITYAGLVIAYFAFPGEIGWYGLVWTFILMAVVTVMDFLLPPYLTGICGGSKYATWGSIIGIFVGLFIPMGMILGPWLGAFFGELIHDHNDIMKALKVSSLSFIGFILTTGVKLIACFIITIYIGIAVWCTYA